MQREACGRGDAERALLGRAAAILTRGGIVALPTETVYALWARADDPAALARLGALGAPNAPLCWHAASAGELERFPRASPLARRLAARYWPGPLTLALPGAAAGVEALARDGWTAVRVPAHPFALSLLASLPFPIAAASTHREGRTSGADPDELARAAPRGVELLVDGGRTRLGEPSALLVLGPGRFELQRTGLHTREELAAAAGLAIAFVCTGNTCRSPMAEALARALLCERLGVPPARLGDFGFELVSLGLQASVGDGASSGARELMKERGLDLSGHRARRATQEALLAADRAYCMTRAHREAVLAALPPSKAAGVELLDPRGGDVPDPVGGGRADYQKAAEKIEAALRLRLEEWA